jgi:glycosyltransferase involved in cell wall biosynthesis
MFQPIKVMDVELSSKLNDIEGLSGYEKLKVLVRLHGQPVGYITIGIQGDRCPAKDLMSAILNQHSRTIIVHLLNHRLARPLDDNGLSIENLLWPSPPEHERTQPLVTVAICTRDRTDDLKLCLDSIIKLSYPNLEVLVVDNAPKNDATKQLVFGYYPKMRYICEPRPGLDWARNRAIIEAKGEIIAFTDDDVVVDSRWIDALSKIFVENPEVMTVTGLVVPYELETEAQCLFEIYGGFGRGFQRKLSCLDTSLKKKNPSHIGTGIFGTGANMAYRCCLFEKIGGFDTALDVGSVTNGGGDLEMFFRVIHEGYSLVYEPNAIVYHRHRHDYASLKTQLTNFGMGFYSYLVRTALAYPSDSLTIIRFGIWWIWWWGIRRLIKSLIRPTYFPRDLILAEMKGSWIGLFRYFRAKRHAKTIMKNFMAVEPANKHKELIMLQKAKNRKKSSEPVKISTSCAFDGTSLMKKFSPNQNSTAVRNIDLIRPLSKLDDISRYPSVQIFVELKGRLLGSLHISNCYKPFGKTFLCDAIVDRLTIKLLEVILNLNSEDVYKKAKAILTMQYMSDKYESSAILPPDVSVSVVVATLDRPEELRKCLLCLRSQKSTRKVEIIVVDNNPSSGLTPPVVSEFSDIILVNEQRKGLSYARNTGFINSTGNIVVTTDDDVRMPENWLEKLIAPFKRNDVMAVTGNVLPFELETKAQYLFEQYGGLGRGFNPLEKDGKWFENFRFRSVPTWELGGTANAAFRATIFSNPKIGMMDEALGAGMPTGCSEDTYLFYKILKANHTIVYEPSAFVWHKHRREMKAFRKQIYNYSKGHVAYHLTTLIRDRDFRAIQRLFFGLPRAHIWRILNRLRGRSAYPLSLIMLEFVGNIAGPFVLWKSRKKVKKLGRSNPYIPASYRLNVSQSTQR